MIANAIVLIVVGLSLAQFWLKFNVVTSLATLFVVLFSAIAAFGYYECLADLLISKGYLIKIAQPLCLVLLFGITLAILWIIAETKGDFLPAR